MKKRVLFLCTGNSARSQMAEGHLRRLAGDRFEVFSAGTHPVGLNPKAVAAMKEIGVDISNHHSKSVDDFVGQEFDYVITVCDSAKESCPIFAGAANRLHYSFPDPGAAQGSVDEQMQVFRKVRDAIGMTLQVFLRNES
jgi:arsenate reductase